MDTGNKPEMKQPDSDYTKKAEGSFVKRNMGSLIAVFAVILIGFVGWYVVGRIKALKQRYQNMIIEKPDTSGKQIVNEKDSVFTQPYTANTGLAKLNISGGATIYLLDDTTSLLFKADTKAFHNKYQFDSRKEGSVSILTFRSENRHENEKWGNNSDTAKFKLNINPEWEINIEAGAAEVNFDLSKYKLKSMKIKGGAAEFVVKVGQPLEKTDIDVSTGASEVTINIPRDAACYIESEAGLSSTTFDGFTRKDEGHYETPGFESAKNKMYIHISGGISDITVKRY